MSDNEPDRLDYVVGALKRLGELGITTSICYGPERCGYSVMCVNRDWDMFDRPIAGRTILHCCDIAIIEARVRGWVKEDE